jgi:hypothetical protein
VRSPLGRGVALQAAPLPRSSGSHLAGNAVRLTRPLNRTCNALTCAARAVSGRAFGGTRIGLTDQQDEALPEALHRYRGRDEVFCGRLEDLLANDRIWSTSPIRFNDPYDCRVRLMFDGSRRDWEKFLSKQYAKHSDLSSSKRKREIRTRLRERFWEDPGAHSEILAGFQVGVDNSGVLCLCESATNPLMWAHYAEGHQGICLRFDTSSLPFSKAERIRYQLNYPSASFMADAREQMEACLLTKAKWWEYEGEWRVVAYNRGEGYWPIANDALRAVILGMKADQRLADEVRRLCSNRNPPVEVLQATPRSDSYELQLLNAQVPPNPGPQPDVTAGAVPRG